MEIDSQFPSPIGELHFSIVKEENAQKYANSFRPLSGSYISQYEHGNIKDYMCACFRPLSGSYISQSFFEWAANEGYMFPSPIGELHFSINEKIQLIKNHEKSFRPLSGSYISQYSKIEAFQQNLCIVSVPYRGATFLNEMFLKVQSLYHVSVPYRGATFLNNEYR